jgi:hypothetical protein
MKVMGIHLLKGQMRYSVLRGSKASPELIEKDRLDTIDVTNIPELMNWFDTNFNLLISKIKPQRVSYRLTLTPKKDQLFYLEFPYGILNLICYKKGIPINNYTSKSFNPSRLGQPKSIDLYKYCNDVFGDNPPYWDTNQKNSILVAWFDLK